MQKPYLTIVIPAYREEHRIGETLQSIDRYLEQRKIVAEVLVVVDGSPDDTAEVVRNYALRMPYIRVIEHTTNKGKGHAVRTGLSEAVGEYVLFMDADGSTSIDHTDALLEKLVAGADVVVGSRRVAGADIHIHQSRYRELSGSIGNILIRSMLGLWRYPDTQCGFKGFTRTAAHTLARLMVVDRFGFDFELVALAARLRYRIVQLPVRWMNDGASTVSLTGPNGYLQVMRDLVRVRARLWFGDYSLQAKTLQ